MLARLSLLLLLRRARVFKSRMEVTNDSCIWKSVVYSFHLVKLSEHKDFILGHIRVVIPSVVLIVLELHLSLGAVRSEPVKLSVEAVAYRHCVRV